MNGTWTTSLRPLPIATVTDRASNRCRGGSRFEPKVERFKLAWPSSVKS